MSIFCDLTIVEFIAGRGGDGSVHFRREKYIDRGGPDGGDAGHGGNIILVSDPNMNTLSDFNTKKLYKAEDGGNGQKKNMHGKDGDDLTLKVPAGTIIKNEITKEIIADLNKPGSSFIVAKGGKGGLGNTHFKSSVHKTPEFAENGEAGEAKKVIIELKLVADVGIIGFPSAGKSTLISRISKAKPKIAAYPFTTLIPNLGVVEMSQFDKKSKDSFVVADIPGLIEGAHEGKGLGHEFLRHVSRAEILVHLIDPTRENVKEDFKIINHELKEHDENLAKKEQIVVINKTDAVDEETIEKDLKSLVKAYPKLKGKILKISALTGEGLKELAFVMQKAIGEMRKEKTKTVEAQEKQLEKSERVFRPDLEKKKFMTVYRREKLEASTKKMRKIFDVEGERIEQVVKMTDVENPEGLERIFHFLNKMGINHSLRKQGAQPGDKIRIAGKTFRMR